jgi:hypothetical protein
VLVAVTSAAAAALLAAPAGAAGRLPIPVHPCVLEVRPAGACELRPADRGDAWRARLVVTSARPLDVVGDRGYGALAGGGFRLGFGPAPFHAGGWTVGKAGEHGGPAGGPRRLRAVE